MERTQSKFEYLNHKTMKKLLATFAIAACLVSAAVAQEEGGIRFFHGTWDEALQEAREQGKMLFVDIWASWCAPCKRMASTTFMEKEVGDYFNAHFVNYKLQTDPADKAARQQAEALAQKYHANFLPTLVWVDADGRLLHFATGYKPAADLLAEAETAQDPKQRIGTILQRWADGDRSVETAVAYFSLFPHASDEFDDYYLGLPRRKQRDIRLRDLMSRRVQLSPSSPVPDYVASLWAKRRFKKRDAFRWEMFLWDEEYKQFKAAAADSAAFRQAVDKWRAYGLMTTETYADRAWCEGLFDRQEYDAGYRFLASLEEKRRMSIIMSVLYTLYFQLREGTLPAAERRPVLMEYAARSAELDKDDEDIAYIAYEKCAIACIICGEREKAEQYVETAISLIPDDDMKQFHEESIRNLLRPLK